ncbi:MAG: nitronate monooxygenase [Bacillota bacterium]|nr:nitronate monooxygenase [Bacillota bacterium]
MWKTEITDLLKIDYPIIQAPMAGGITTPELVAAVSNAGGLGMIGAGYLSSVQIRDQIREVKQRTKHPFGINLFVPALYQETDEKVNKARAALLPLQEELGLKTLTELPRAADDLKTFIEQINVVLEEKVPICSFTFGIPSNNLVEQLRKHHIKVFGTATTVEEAKLIEAEGMDAIVAQGSEAGGHRGTFADSFESSLIGTMSLVPQVVDSVKIPVIAAGGIMDGRGMNAARCLGASAVQLGTAFLTCHESGAHEIYKNKIFEAAENDTVLTRSFSGKMARGIENRFIREMKPVENDLPVYPIQNELTRELRKYASSQNTPDYMSLWCGQSPRLAKKISVTQLMERIISQAEKLGFPPSW